MSFIENINRVSASYFHIENRKTCLDGLKIASYFFTLGLLPLFVGLFYGVTSLLLGRVKKADEGSHQNVQEQANKALGKLAQPNEKEQNPYDAGQAPFEKLPRDIKEGVLLKKNYLTLKDLGRLVQASKTVRDQYKPTINEAWSQRKAAMTIGPQQWIDVIGLDKMQVLGIDVKNIPDFPENIDEILKAPCPFNLGKRVYQTHRLVLIPEYLTIYLLGCLMKHPKKEVQEMFKSFETVLIIRDQNIWDKIGATSEKKSSWVLMTYDVIPESINKRYSVQQEMIKNYPGYELSSVLEAIFLVTMHLHLTGQYLLPGNPLTNVRCRDEKIKDMPLHVGCFSPAGLHVFRQVGFADKSVGIFGVRKLA